MCAGLIRTAPVSARTVPGPPFVGAAVFGMVIELSQPLVELGTDRTPLQVRHRQFVLRLDKRLRSNRKQFKSHEGSCTFARES